MKANASRWGGLATLLLLAVQGCGGKDGLVAVNGVVTLDGKPVENAMVTFIPEAGKGRHAIGRTGADGSFKLTTLQPDDGAAPGDYKVIVVYEEGVEVPPAGNVKEAFQGMERARQQQKKKPPKYVIPTKYSDPGKPVLRSKVPASGTVKVELQSR